MNETARRFAHGKKYQSASKLDKPLRKPPLVGCLLTVVIVMIFFTLLPVGIVVGVLIRAGERTAPLGSG